MTSGEPIIVMPFHIFSDEMIFHVVCGTCSHPDISGTDLFSVSHSFKKDMSDKEKRECALIVDGQYWFTNEKEHELDVMKLISFVQEKAQVTIEDRYWLDRQLSEPRKNFLRSATGPRFSVKEYPSKPKQCPCCKEHFPVQSGCDVGIALRLFRLSQDFKKIVLIAGDGDFEEALEYAREIARCDVILACFLNNSSTKLHPYARSVILLDPNERQLKRSPTEDRRESEDRRPVAFARDRKFTTEDRRNTPDRRGLLDDPQVRPEERRALEERRAILEERRANTNKMLADTKFAESRHGHVGKAPPAPFPQGPPDQPRCCTAVGRSLLLHRKENF
jgi:uncharacterized LabA/DUF88 family protein